MKIFHVRFDMKYQFVGLNKGMANSQRIKTRTLQLYGKIMRLNNFLNVRFVIKPDKNALVKKCLHYYFR